MLSEDAVGARRCPHHMLIGLQGPIEAAGYEEDVEINLEIASKMSKSIPEISISVHDDLETIKSKIDKAYCPLRTVCGNPILEYAEYTIFRNM